DTPTGTASDVDTSGVTLSDDATGPATGTATATVTNVAPSDLVLNSGTIDENGTFTLSGSFTDPGTLDLHTVMVNWGEGPPELVTLPVGQRTFTLTHQYLDDNPTNTPSDVYTVGVTVADDDTGSLSASTSVTVRNVDPTRTALWATSVNEGGTSTLRGTIGDVGTQDTFKVEIDWDGDGTYDQTLTGLAAGTFTATHTYPDDGPSPGNNTPSDTYQVRVR